MVSALHTHPLPFNWYFSSLFTGQWQRHYHPHLSSRRAHVLLHHAAHTTLRRGAPQTSPNPHEEAPPLQQRPIQEEARLRSAYSVVGKWRRWSRRPEHGRSRRRIVVSLEGREAAGCARPVLSDLFTDWPGVQGQICVPLAPWQVVPGEGVRFSRTPVWLDLFHLSFHCVSSCLVSGVSVWWFVRLKVDSSVQIFLHAENQQFVDLSICFKLMCV